MKASHDFTSLVMLFVVLLNLLFLYSNQHLNKVAAGHDFDAPSALGSKHIVSALTCFNIHPTKHLVSRQYIRAQYAHALLIKSV